MVKILAINKNYAMPSVCDNQNNHQQDLKQTHLDRIIFASE